MFKVLSSNAVLTVMPSGYYYYCEGMFHLIFVCKKTKMGRGVARLRQHINDYYLFQTVYCDPCVECYIYYKQ